MNEPTFGAIMSWLYKLRKISKRYPIFAGISIKDELTFLSML